MSEMDDEKNAEGQLRGYTVDLSRLTLERVLEKVQHEEWPGFLKAMEHETDTKAIEEALRKIRITEATLKATATMSGVSVTIKPPKKAVRIYKPIGHGLSGTLRFILPKKVFERVVEQMILDAREEHLEALAAGRVNHARWIAIRLYVLVGSALAIKFVTLPFEKFTQFFAKD